jgi:hypothetical protein
MSTTCFPRVSVTRRRCPRHRLRLGDEALGWPEQMAMNERADAALRHAAQRHRRHEIRIERRRRIGAGNPELDRIVGDTVGARPQAAPVIVRVAERGEDERARSAEGVAAPADTDLDRADPRTLNADADLARGGLAAGLQQGTFRPHGGSAARISVVAHDTFLPQGAARLALAWPPRAG